MPMAIANVGAHRIISKTSGVIKVDRYPLADP